MLGIISDTAATILLEAIENIPDSVHHWHRRFEEASPSEYETLKRSFRELEEHGLVQVVWTHDSRPPFLVTVEDKGKSYMVYDNPIRNKIKLLLDEAIAINSPINVTSGKNIDKYNEPASMWVSNAKIIIDRHLKTHPLYDQMFREIFHKKVYAFNEIKNNLTVVLYDDEFWVNAKDEIGIKRILHVASKAYPPGYDVFISHANADKQDFVKELNESIKKLGINIFYDTDSLDWGDKWKDRIIEGTENARFAIIVVSVNFFGREWTEEELNRFMHRENQSGNKVILPIIHGITFEQLKERYPALSDIHAIDSSKYSTDQIALKFAKILIEDLKQN